MKEVLLTLLVGINLLIIDSVFAAPIECSNEIITQSKTDLKNITYDLKYLPDITDQYGNALEGRFKILMRNLPEGYAAFISKENTRVPVYDDGIEVVGGVYTLNIYSELCQKSLKKIEIRIPTYKTYCYLNKSCDEQPWFDGTYENNGDINKAELLDKNQSRTVLMLMLILTFSVVICLIVIVRRKKNETML